MDGLGSSMIRTGKVAAIRSLRGRSERVATESHIRTVGAVTGEFDLRMRRLPPLPDVSEGLAGHPQVTGGVVETGSAQFCAEPCQVVAGFLERVHWSG